MFKETETEKLKFNPFNKIGGEWALLTAGTKETGFNMMTVSWAGFGRFWEKDAVTVYARASRYTRQFMEENDLFTLSFYGEEYRRALDICGSLHGNKCDKAKEAGLKPLFLGGATAFEEADLIFVCKKLIHADVEQKNADDTDVFNSTYPEPDLHRIYIGEVVKVLKKQ
jgi:flavin reductase (DIM6/NTAB) family NADH-FMN oxidoreductase RutF